MNIDDIEGAKPKPEVFLKKPNFMDARDISQNEWKTKRTTNPLDPEYEVYNEQGEKYKIGQVLGSKPRTGHGVREQFYRPLTTDDIDGAKPGTTNGYLKRVKQMRNQTLTQDISGAQAGTLKKAFNTNRITNPLNPEYPYIGQSQEKAQQQQKIQAEVKKQVDLQLEQSKAQFFAVTPPIDAIRLPLVQQQQIKEIVRPQSEGFQENAARFFCSSRGRTSSQEQNQFERSRNKFYETPKQNKNVGSFHNVMNPGSIHARPGRPPLPVQVDQELLKNQQEFYADQIAPPVQKKEDQKISGSKNQEKPYHLNQTKFFHQESPKQILNFSPEAQKIQAQQDTANSQENSANGNENKYKFGLQRQEIGQPKRFHSKKGGGKVQSFNPILGEQRPTSNSIRKSENTLNS